MCGCGICVCILHYGRDSGRKYPKWLNIITSEEEVGFGQSKGLREMSLVFQIFKYDFKTKF